MFLRPLAIELLDDDTGISEVAYMKLIGALLENGEQCEDIEDAVDMVDGRIYLPVSFRQNSYGR